MKKWGFHKIIHEILLKSNSYVFFYFESNSYVLFNLSDEEMMISKITVEILGNWISMFSIISNQILLYYNV